MRFPADLGITEEKLRSTSKIYRIGNHKKRSQRASIAKVNIYMIAHVVKKDFRRSIFNSTVRTLHVSAARRGDFGTPIGASLEPISPHGKHGYGSQETAFRRCKIPFQYKGLTYSQCATVDHTGPWCYFDDNNPKAWGNC